MPSVIEEMYPGIRRVDPSDGRVFACGVTSQVGHTSIQVHRSILYVGEPVLVEESVRPDRRQAVLT